MRTRVAIVLPYFGAGGGEHIVSCKVNDYAVKGLECKIIIKKSLLPVV